MVTMQVPGCLRNAARSVAERSGRNLPATDIDPATEGACAGLGQSGPHMATGLPHPWHIRPMAEPLRPGQNSRCERGMWTAAVNAACHVVRVRCHDRETTPWRSRSQARGHVRQTGQDGGGVASQARISGRGAPAPIHGEPNNRNHPFLCKNRTWSIDIRPARTKLSRCRAASDWVPANQPGPPGCRPATLSRR